MVAIVLFATSCTALHSPISDAHIQGNRTTNKRSSAGLSLATSQLSRNFDERLVEEYKRETSGDMLALRYRYGISILKAWGNDIWSIGAAVGSGGVGADVTWKPGKHILLTLVGNAHGSAELDVHSIIALDSTSSVGLGVFFRSERHGVLGNGCNDSSTWFCYDTSVDRHFRVNAFGIRVSLYQERSPARFYVGYSPELKRPMLIVNVGLVFPGKRGRE